MCWGLCQHVFLKYTRLIAWHLVFVIVFSVSRDITMVNCSGLVSMRFYFAFDLAVRIHFVIIKVWNVCTDITSNWKFLHFLCLIAKWTEMRDVASLWQMFESFSWCFRFCFCFASQTMARKWAPPKCLGTCGTEQENALNRFS